MLPYWDWTDPAPIMSDTFLGPNGDPGTQIVRRGCFAADAPGIGDNPTPVRTGVNAIYARIRHARIRPDETGVLRSALQAAS